MNAGILPAPLRPQILLGHNFSSRATSNKQRALEDPDHAVPKPAPLRAGQDEAVSRRSALLAVAAATAMCPELVPAAHASEQQQSTQGGVLASSVVDYSEPGPLTAAMLPELEHTCTRCFPACLGNRCMLSLNVVYPKDGKAHGEFPCTQGFCQTIRDNINWMRLHSKQYVVSLHLDSIDHIQTL